MVSYLERTNHSVVRPMVPSAAFQAWAKRPAPFFHFRKSFSDDSPAVLSARGMLHCVDPEIPLPEFFWFEAAPEDMDIIAKHLGLLHPSFQQPNFDYPDIFLTSTRKTLNPLVNTPVIVEFRFRKFRRSRTAAPHLCLHLLRVNPEPLDRAN